jgi:calcium-translocating P-type ATPase
MKPYGLTTTQAEESKRKYGDNRLTEQATESFLDKFKGNLGDPMIKILCVALGINIVFSVLGALRVIGEGAPEWYESAGIAAAIAIATMVSTFSEYKNENAFQKLQEEASQIVCKVFRDGEIVELPINDIVVDDCVMLQAGDKIPADGIIVKGEISVDQAVLNGETTEARKLIMPDDYVEQDSAMDFLNEYKVFRGSVVCGGGAFMSVTTVGDKSVYGQIAAELQQDDERDTPLKVKLGNLANGISKFGYIGGVVIAVALLFQRIVIHNGFDIAQITAYCSNWLTIVQDLIQAIMLAVIIIVMAVPEGLPLMIAIVSALNMGKMLKDNVLIRKVAGIETAGSLNILFSDKTGTITKGQLEAVVFVSGDAVEFKSFKEVAGELGNVLQLSIHRNTDAVISGLGDNQKVIGGNATERAILGFAAGHTGDMKGTVIRSVPFDSKNKYSASQIGQGLTLIKGAPEKILERCKNYYGNDGNKVELNDIVALTKKIDELAERAIRVLALATSGGDLAEDGALPQDDWTLVGVLGIRDEVRSESVAAIREVRNAGVQVVMITGDRKETAVAIAKEAGLLTSLSDIVMTSEELAEVSDSDLKRKLPNIRVIARALPSDKSRLVRAAQDLNLVVGMTGDGVNDSPALKASDVGFAMGGGTEVAKEAAEIIIMDDNFSSIDKAILYGRTIFNSIRKFIIFQLTINVAAVLVSFAAPLLGMENPLTIIQILWVNLVMDTLAALAFGGEPALKRVMAEKPKLRDEAIVSGYMWSSILTGSLLTFALSMVFLLSGVVSGFFREGGETQYLLTGYFAFFIFIAVFNAFNARTDRFNLFDNIGKNKGFLRVIGVIAVVQIALVHLGGAVFGCHGLNIKEWIVVLVMAILIIPIDIIRKVIIKCHSAGANRKLAFSLFAVVLVTSLTACSRVIQTGGIVPQNTSGQYSDEQDNGQTSLYYEDAPVDLLRRFQDANNSRDIQALMECYDPDYIKASSEIGAALGGALSDALFGFSVDADADAVMPFFSKVYQKYVQKDDVYAKIDLTEIETTYSDNDNAVIKFQEKVVNADGSVASESEQQLPVVRIDDIWYISAVDAVLSAIEGQLK